MYKAKATTSLYDLVLATRRFDPKRVERTPFIDLVIKDVIPYFGTKSILFRGDCTSGSTKQHYPSVIAFYGIEFIDGEENWKRNMLKFENPGTKEVVVCNQVDYRRSPVRIYCACADYYYTFAYPNFNKNCYFGRKPKPYKKVANSGYPRRNRDNIPGLCKHALNMIDVLAKQGYVK